MGIDADQAMPIRPKQAATIRAGLEPTKRIGGGAEERGHALGLTESNNMRAAALDDDSAGAA